MNTMNTDTLHEPGTRREWNESFYFNFYDPSTDVCGFMRIGHKPNKGVKDVFCYLMLPDGSFIGMKESVEKHDDALTAGGLSFEMVEPERTWRMTYEGMVRTFSKTGPVEVPLTFSLRFDALSEIYDYRRSVGKKGEEMSRDVASEHLEQFGRITGHVSTETAEYDIDALGERDHSWGVREWTSPKQWIWLNAHLSPDCSINLTKLTVEEGEVDAGFIFRDGTLTAVTSAQERTTYDDEGEPVSFVLDLTDENGRTHTVSGTVERSVHLPFASPDGSELSVMYETLARYEYEGMTGYGIAEYLVRKRG
jgi:hypothetical protein